MPVNSRTSRAAPGVARRLSGGSKVTLGEDSNEGQLSCTTEYRKGARSGCLLKNMQKRSHSVQADTYPKVLNETHRQFMNSPTDKMPFKLSVSSETGCFVSLPPLSPTSNYKCMQSIQLRVLSADFLESKAQGEGKLERG